MLEFYLLKPTRCTPVFNLSFNRLETFLVHTIAWTTNKPALILFVSTASFNLIHTVVQVSIIFHTYMTVKHLLSLFAEVDGLII